MARGFESKQVESQQAEAERRRELRARDGAPHADAGHRHTLELAVRDVRHRLETARDERLRIQLGLALEALEAQLREAGPPARDVDSKGGGG
jgi:hypothetical protein